jgi:hypothetical protein
MTTLNHIHTLPTKDKNKRGSNNNLTQSGSPPKSNPRKKLIEILAGEKEEDLRFLCTFMTEYCSLASTLDTCPERDNCIKAHSKDDNHLRRNPFSSDFTQIRYLPFMCPQGDLCVRHQNCSSAHNELEIKFHPITYKTILCEHGLAC